ncbi:MAG: hypothetical protein RRB22_01465 [Gammaproteobacteria bacterium]|nr:hypothetical protein [Gammaproteobacteria bacterium]
MTMNKTRLIIIAALTATLWGCGGGGGGTDTTPAATPAPSGNTNNDPAPAPAPAPTTDPYTGGTYSGGTVPAAQVGATVVGLTIEELSGVEQTSVPVTFGQVFKPGEIPAGSLLAVRLATGTQSLLPNQVTKKATHADGSLRHAIISTRIPTLAANSQQDIEIVVVDSVPVAQSVRLADLLATNFDGVVSLTVASTPYTASIADLLTTTQSQTWLSGPEVTEWIVSAPLKAADGTEHPHLTARFNIRAYASFDSVRVDVIIENNWAYVPNPQNFVYDATVSLCGNNVYSKTGLTHYHHARWRKTFWCGNEPAIHVKHDVDYLIDSYAIPSYDRNLVIPESDLASMEADWTGSKTEPMGIGFARADMPGTGAAPDIGPLPRWTTRYLLSQDKRAKATTLGTADSAGSWSIHYRDQTSNLPVTLVDHPKMTILANYSDTYNSSTGQYEAFPACSGDCATPYRHDSPHQPSLTYLPYLVTGDHYYLEELMFWTNYNMFESNPNYRETGKGLLGWGQVRGQAWAMRALGQAAYITPDSDPLKSYFAERLQYNLDWYNDKYVTNTPPNQLGFLQNGYTFIYTSGRGIAPWMDDFFTWSMGYLAELGFSDAEPVLAWKAQFPINRMLNTEYCWIFASTYNLNMRNDSASPVYTSWAEVYNNRYDPAITSLSCDSQQMADYLGTQTGEMTGYADLPTGYTSNLQPALAVSANVSIQNGQAAWAKFDSRSVKPDYSTYPNFAIVPRN